MQVAGVYPSQGARAPPEAPRVSAVSTLAFSLLKHRKPRAHQRAETRLHGCADDRG